MTKSDSKFWDKAVQEELLVITKIIEPLGFSIDKNQPHLSGEGFLLLKEKLVLVGRRTADKKRVIIKISKHDSGQSEIRRERDVLNALVKMLPSNGFIHLPGEVYFGQVDGYLIWISKFIEQEQIFAAKPVEEQFSLALNIFKALESFHISTSENLSNVSGVFEIANAETYIRSFPNFMERVLKHSPGNHQAVKILSKAEAFMNSNKKVIEKYCWYLLHRDFAPSNMRVSGQNVYLIDLSSMRFGNKYEGWARFLNWALLHSPELEKLLSDYVRQNRGEEEFLCLRLMRMYGAGFLIRFYAETLKKISGDLLLLNQKRLELWSFIMESLLKDQPIPTETLEEYWSECNRLRSKEEIERQKEINIPTL